MTREEKQAELAVVGARVEWNGSLGTVTAVGIHSEPDYFVVEVQWDDYYARDWYSEKHIRRVFNGIQYLKKRHNL